jgi:signal transduction histidine kinase
MDTSLPIPLMAPATGAPAERAVDAAAAQARAIEAENVRTLYAKLPASFVGLNLAAFVVVWMFWGAVSTVWLTGWLVLVELNCAVRYGLLRRFRAARPDTLEQWRRWRWWWNAGTLLSGSLWGLASWIFYLRDSVLHEVGLASQIYGLCVGAIPLLSIQFRVFLAYSAVTLLPLVVRIALEGTPQHLSLAFVLFVNFAFATLFGRNFRQVLERTTALKVENEHLAKRFREEADAAQHARNEAEVANRAKTQFFAAASHDLRQPLHALGLFAETLRQRSHDEEVAHLVNSINGSVDALEGLFSELLDITKIDTGGVESVPQHFALDGLFRRLRLHFEPVAFEKGLELRFRGGKQHVFADPVLTERILRNLVSNAIRYTNDGGVLVGARRRGGHLLLQVWDSGVGIKPQHQARVFEEFYQVSNDASALQAHHRKGLGLGLAIVRRLAALMKAPLHLRSEPGHGSVFSIELPLGRVPRVSAGSLSPKPTLGLTLERRLILVVEDEPAVRSGLEVLLKSWGAGVLSFESAQSAKAWSDGSADARPDLLIVDYRLEDGSTGVDVIEHLRMRFGRTLPAMVVTGSLMSGHEKEAHDHEFHLLLKPVVPNKLRAMIAFKLGVR